MARLVDTQAAAAAARVEPATIRSWAHRGKLEKVGSDYRGRTLYSLDDVYRLASARRDRPQVADEAATVQHS